MTTDLMITDAAELMLLQAGRCWSCNHLNVVHNEHCCYFCKVPGCECKTMDPTGVCDGPSA